MWTIDIPYVVSTEIFLSPKNLLRAQTLILRLNFVLPQGLIPGTPPCSCSTPQPLVSILASSRFPKLSHLPIISHFHPYLSFSSSRFPKLSHLPIISRFHPYLSYFVSVASGSCSCHMLFSWKTLTPQALLCPSQTLFPLNSCFCLPVSNLPPRFLPVSFPPLSFTSHEFPSPNSDISYCFVPLSLSLIPGFLATDSTPPRSSHSLQKNTCAQRCCLPWPHHFPSPGPFHHPLHLKLDCNPWKSLATPLWCVRVWGQTRKVAGTRCEIFVFIYMSTDDTNPIEPLLSGVFALRRGTLSMWRRGSSSWILLVPIWQCETDTLCEWLAWNSRRRRDSRANGRLVDIILVGS